MSHKSGRLAARADEIARPAARRDYGALAVEIRRVRVQLMRSRALGDTRVQTELSELYRQVIAAQDERRGRHRLSAGAAPAPAPAPARRPVAACAAVADAPGYAFKPDPLAATTGAELVAALRRFRDWAGPVSYRKMAEQARHQVPYSTMYKALAGESLPDQKVVAAIVAGCGGSPEDVSVFVTACRQIRAGQAAARPAGRTLRVLPAPAKGA